MAASFRGHKYDAPVPEKLQALVAPHINSFNYFINQGLEEAIGSLEPVEIADNVRNCRVKLWVDRPTITRPQVDDGSRAKLYPTECRESAKTYKGDFKAEIIIETDNGVSHRIPYSFGKMPIMVKSTRCHLEGLTQKELIKKGEESLEMGGYFICNGIERIVRMLIMPKRNYVMALRRSAFMRKGLGYSDMATVIRCTRPDQSSITNRVIYVQDGTAVIGFTYRKNEYFMPVGIVLKALAEASDQEIFQRLVSVVGRKGEPSVGTPFVTERALLLLGQARKKSLYTRSQCLAYLGKNFRAVLDVPLRKSNAFVGDKIIRECVLVHLQHPQDKFNLLIFLLQKLYALVDGTAQEDNPDTLQHHDLLLPGHLLAMVVKERIQQFLSKVKEQCEKDLQTKAAATNLEDPAVVKKVMDKVVSNVGQQVEYLLNTGNLVSQSGLDLQQTSGFTVVAEKLNFLRYISHFRSVHRGAYFAELRTTTVRKLLPESWGFLCPVHTPDGSPCGLLNHLTMPCLVTEDADQGEAAAPSEGVHKALGRVLARHGLVPVASGMPPPGPPSHLAVLLDGCVIGHLHAQAAPAAVADLRRQKVTAGSGIPADLEVGYVPYSLMGTFPGLFLFSTSARMVRPVRQLDARGANGTQPALELIGPFEQVYMEIRCLDGGNGGRDMESQRGGAAATHEETHPTAMLSVVANLTPWSDYNQSPRNMYQCQMGKQTMGVPVQAYSHRSDGKLYRLQTPQTPIARTGAYRDYCMDDFPTGTNAVVAVLAHTGYDMEDAMIINKSSMERGFGHGQIYKTETIDLSKGVTRKDVGTSFFARPADKGRGAQNRDLEERIGPDGLPQAGQRVMEGQVYCSVINRASGVAKLSKLKGTEQAVVDQVTVMGTGPSAPLQKASIKMRFGRNPVIGDKFSSRHGQKGVLSQLWPDVNMPFTYSSGMRPDIIINPHAFPSRMTIGMLVESMASKSGALHGNFVNATPFRSSVKDPPPYVWPSDRKPLPSSRRRPAEPNGRGRQGQDGSDRMDIDGDEEARGSERNGGGSGGGDGSVPRNGEGGKEGTVIEEFGRQLVAKGFNHYGTEVMYSGVLGTELTCEIYIGLVYYQRLRHMVSDKFQVRSTGPVNPLTMQPVKGRKFGGGIRFGEMERDALLSHGAAFLLHDRLHRCSDYHTTYVCSLCGSLLSPWTEPPIQDPASTIKLEGSNDNLSKRRVLCQTCETGKGIHKVAMPYVFKYLAAELAAMNIKVTLTLVDT